MRNRAALTAASALLAALLLARPCAAINELAGTSGAQFLKLGAGARAGAMADSFSAIADDAYAAYYNPAGLTQLRGSQLAGAHTVYFEGISYEVLGFAYPVSRGDTYSKHVLAFGVYHLGIGDIEKRASDTTDPVGTFGASDGAYAFSYAYGASRRLSLGLTGKYIVQDIDSYHASAAAADLGLLYKLNPDAKRPMSVAAVVKNVGTRPGFVSGQNDPLPASGTLGLGYEALPKRLKLNLDLSKYRDSDAYAALGGEYLHPFNENVGGALRFGYTSLRRENDGLNGLALGGGVSFYKASVDLAWVPFGHLGDTFRFSLLIKF